MYLQYIGTFPRKLHAKKENKLIKQFLRNQYFKWKFDGRWTDDGRIIEKLRCLSQLKTQ